jgi:outer membrane murein-binding lipoprotein Lpp
VVPSEAMIGRRHEAAFAVVLAGVLAVGVIGVLLLNTAMQQQSDTLDRQRAHIAQLGTQVEQLRTTIERAGEPTVLARRARALRLRPADRVHYVSAVTAPRPGAN